MCLYYEILFFLKYLQTTINRLFLDDPFRHYFLAIHHLVHFLHTINPSPTKSYFPEKERRKNVPMTQGTTKKVHAAAVDRFP